MGILKGTVTFWKPQALLMALALTALPLGGNIALATEGSEDLELVAPVGPQEEAESPVSLIEEAPAPTSDTDHIAKPAPPEALPQISTAKKESPGEELHRVAITHNEVPFFYIYQKGGDPGDLEARAREASDNLFRAFETAPLKDIPETLQFEQTDQELKIQLVGLLILTLNLDDLKASGFGSFDSYQKEIESQINRAFEQRLVRAQWQSRAKTFFLTFFFLLIGLLALGQISNLFERAEESLLERKERFQPVSIFSETLIQGQTVGALLTFGLVIGRALAYVLVAIAMALAILSQFDASQSLLRNFFTRLVEMMVEGLQALVEAVPSLLLSLLLLLGLYFALKIVSLYLRSLALGRVKVKFLPPNRLPVARFWIPVILFLAFLPFVAATLVGFRFSSIELGIITFGAISLLAFLPVLASGAMGSYIIWTGSVKEGSWLEVGPFHGEVTNINLFEVTLVPEDGGIIKIPMLYLVVKPIHSRPEVPKFEIRFSLKKIGALANTLDRIRELFPEKWTVEVVCQSVNHSDAMVLVRAGRFESKIKSEILQILSDACDAGKIELTSDFVEEILH